MPAMSLQDIIRMVRKGVDDETPGDAYTDGQILDAINAAVSFYDSELAKKASRLFIQSKSITHDGSELQRVAPYLPRIVSIERTSDSPRSLVAPILGGWRSRHGHITNSNVSNATMNRWYVENNQIGMLPAPQSGTDKIWFALSSPELHYGEIASISGVSLVFTAIASASDALGNIIMMDDAYNEIPIMFTETRELNYIIDWDASTLTATLAFTPENSYSAADPYSILSRLHPEHHMVLTHHAIAILRDGADEDVATSKQLERQIADSMYAYIDVEQDQVPQYVEFSDPEFYGGYYEY